MSRATVLLLSLLLGTSLAAQESLNSTGTHGDVILDGDTARTTAGVVLRAKSTRPDVTAETGSTSGTAGFAIFTSAGTELLKVRNDGVIALAGSPVSSWAGGLTPVFEHKEVSLHFGQSDIRLLGNSDLPPGGNFRYKVNDPAGMYALWKGVHYFFGAPAGTAGSTVPFELLMRLEAGPKVGIGTLVPNARLHVSGGATPMIVEGANANGYNVEFKDTMATEGYPSGVLLNMKGNSLIRVNNLQLGFIGNPLVQSIGTNNPLLLNRWSPNDVVIGQAAYNSRLVVEGTGTSTFAGSVSVAGNVSVTGSITGASVIGATYQDLAEWVPSESDLEAGTVVVLSRDRTNAVTAASSAYDTSVAGVVSARPGIILGEGSDSKEMIATTGRVRVRVDARQHPIAIGDLLVSSDRPGRAMKSIPMEIGGSAFHRPGTIIGKALEPLAGGEGEILVLLSLQ